MSDMPNKIAAWRFVPSEADEWLHGGWSEDHDHKTTSYISEDTASAQVTVLKAQIYRLTAAGDNLTAWVDDRGTPDVRKWDRARDEAFAITPADARAALERVRQEAREEGRREGLKEAMAKADAVMKKYAAGTYNKENGQRLQSAAKCYCAGEISQEIEALITKDQANG